jgi:ATP-dependent Clp protease ATP-binding subunit ClpB
VIQKQLQDPLAKLILEGIVKDGDAIKVGVADGALTFNGKILDALVP